MDIATARKKSSFILSDRSDFHMIDNLSMAVNTFISRMLTSLSVDEILLLRYENWSINSRGLPLEVEMAPHCLKHMNSLLFVFQKRPMPPVTCSRLFSRHSAGADVFTQRTRSSGDVCNSFVHFLPFLI